MHVGLTPVLKQTPKGQLLDSPKFHHNTPNHTHTGNTMIACPGEAIWLVTSKFNLLQDQFDQTSPNWVPWYLSEPFTPPSPGPRTSPEKELSASKGRGKWQAWRRRTSCGRRATSSSRPETSTQRGSGTLEPDLSHGSAYGEQFHRFMM